MFEPVYILIGIYKHRPTDKDAKLKFTECKKIVQQKAFQVYIIIRFSQQMHRITLKLIQQKSKNVRILVFIFFKQFLINFLFF